MFISSAFIGLAVFVGIISARPSVEVAKIQAFEGIATFNDYAAQGSTVCGSKTASKLLLQPLREITVYKALQTYQDILVLLLAISAVTYLGVLVPGKSTRVFGM